MNRPRTQSFAQVVVVLLIACAAATAAVIRWRGAGWQSAMAEGSSYTYSVEAKGPNRVGGDTYAVYVDLLNQDNDFSAYKSENDNRIEAWAADPSAAPVVDGRPIRVTFRSPQSYTETVGAIGPYVAEYVAYGIVGSSPSSPERILDGLGEIDPALIGEVTDPACGIAVDSNGAPDPSACETITYSGVIDVTFRLRGGVAALQALKDHPDIYLADTTAIVILEELAGSGIDQRDVQLVDLPPAMYERNGDVSWP